MNQRFAATVDRIPALFDALAKSEAVIEKGSSSLKGKAGVYAFFESGTAVHVGRTRNLLARLRSHVSKNHNAASFAFKRTRKKLNVIATYKAEGGRAALVKDKTFGPEFVDQIGLVRNMDVRFVEVPDPLEQYLLELYAAIEWGLSLEEFDTH
jgi:hypothetical protein